MTGAARVSVHGEARVDEVLALVATIAGVAGVACESLPAAAGAGVEILLAGADAGDPLVAAVLLDGSAAVASARPADGAVAAVAYPAADAAAEDVVRDADVIEGCRAVGMSTGSPGLSQLGIVDGILCDRAFTDERRTAALELATLDDLAAGDGEPVPLVVALAAAAVARAAGIEPVAIRDGLRLRAVGGA